MEINFLSKKHNSFKRNYLERVNKIDKAYFKKYKKTFKKI
jgi:hypothetical protein